MDGVDSLGCVGSVDLETLFDQCQQRTKTQSRRHGYQPQAKAHIDRFLQHIIFEVPVKTLVHQCGLSRSTLYRSINRGHKLVSQGLRVES